MHSTPKTFILTGRSGCGKGTQAKILEELLKTHTPQTPIFHLETGARFREFIKGNLFSNKLANEVSKRGDRQPDFLAIWNWSHLMVEQITGAEHIIIDGTPRSNEEAMVLDSAMTFYRREQPIVIHLDVSRDWSYKHIEARAKAEGRVDDQSPEEINRRLDWFETDVARAIKFYEQSRGYKYIRINGEQSVEQVAEEIRRSISL